MRRRDLLSVFGGAALIALPARADSASSRPFRVGIIALVNPRSAEFYVAFERRLRELGYVEGDDLTIDFVALDGKTERLGAATEELVGRNVDVIVTSGQEQSLKAAKQVTSTTPIVMVAISSDPVALGYVASLARPGGNITGVFYQQLELTGKRLELLKQTVPEIDRVIVFGEVRAAQQFDAAAKAARVLKLPIIPVELREPPYDYARALAGVNPRPGDALFCLSSAFFARDRSRLAELALRHRLPSMFTQREVVDAGGLLSYAPSFSAMYRLAADYVDKILKGSAPADLPIQQPTKFELVVNMKTAEALGLTIPDQILVRADEVIE